MNILIIRLSSIGDILLTTPFVRQIRKKISEANIHYVIKKEYRDLIKYNPHINQLYEFDKNTPENSLKNIIRQLKKVNYDYVFDLHNNFRSIYLRRSILAKYKFYIKKNKIKQTALVCFKINLYKQIKTIAERYFETGIPVGIEDDGHGLEIFWQEDTEKDIIRILNDAQVNLKKNTIAIAPGAGYYTKRWPAEYFMRLVNMINNEYNLNIFIIGGNNEKELGEHLGGQENVYNFAGKLNLIQTAVLLDKTSLLISNDSGVMHLATAVQTPVVALFGSSVKELGFYPYRSENIVLENNELNCRPCSHVGRNKCPRHHFKCMKDIKAESVLEAAEKYL